MLQRLVSKDFWTRVWTRSEEDEILARAAQLSYYFLLAIFPLLIFLINSYNATYGSLGALIILMLWFYLTGAAILLGGEINCEFESGE